MVFKNKIIASLYTTFIFCLYYITGLLNKKGGTSDLSVEKKYQCILKYYKDKEMVLIQGRCGSERKLEFVASIAYDKKKVMIKDKKSLKCLFVDEKKCP